MLAKVHTTACVGIDAYPVDIEVDVSHGLPVITIVGLPDQVVKESKERVRTAIRNSGYELSSQRVTINLAPANTKKEGPSFDLAIAIGWLAASGYVNTDALDSFAFVGELALNGSLKPTKGVLASTLLLQGKEQTLIVPVENEDEATLADDVKIEKAGSLKEVVTRVNGEQTLPRIHHRPPSFKNDHRHENEWQDVCGQETAKRALEVAAGGGHNALLIGSPGAGKTLMARCLPSILPPPTLEEIITITRIYSVSHVGIKNGFLFGHRPFRSPHHSVSTAGLVGGGSLPRPGEVSLAHGGVLFLDEFGEFRKDTLEALRGPLEDGYVQISRAKSGIFIPSRFMLVAAMNPCPCGYLFDEKRKCRCTMDQIRRYHAKISGPILDRIDIHLEVPTLTYKQLRENGSNETAENVRNRVSQTRQIQAERYKGNNFLTNGSLPGRLIGSYCHLSRNAEKLLDEAMQRLHLSARAYHRILKLARTIADMGASTPIQETHIAEAVQYRSLDRKWWGS